MTASIRRAALTLIVALTTAAPAVADEATPPRPNAVQLDLGLAVVGLGYERAIGGHVALQAEAQVFGTWFGPLFDLPHLSGQGGGVRLTLYPTGDGAGPYVAPFARVHRVEGEADGASGADVGWSAGVFGGYSFRLGTRWHVRVGAGAQYLSYEVRAGDVLLTFRQLFPALDAIVGWAF